MVDALMVSAVLASGLALLLLFWLGTEQYPPYYHHHPFYYQPPPGHGLPLGHDPFLDYGGYPVDLPPYSPSQEQLPPVADVEEGGAEERFDQLVTPNKQWPAFRKMRKQPVDLDQSHKQDHVVPNMPQKATGTRYGLKKTQQKR